MYICIYIYINICKADPYASNNGDIELMGHPGHFPTFRFRCPLLETHIQHSISLVQDKAIHVLRRRPEDPGVNPPWSHGCFESHAIPG